MRPSPAVKSSMWAVDVTWVIKTPPDEESMSYGTTDIDNGALVQTRTELTMIDKCRDSYPRKSCSKFGTLTRRSWSYKCVGI